MANLSEKIRALRKEKGISQAEMGAEIGMKMTTYAARETKGNFSEGEITKILETLGVSKQQFDDYEPRGKDSIEISIPEALIVMDSKMDVLLSAVAELLAKANGQSVTGSSNDLLKAVKERYDQKIAGLLK